MWKVIKSDMKRLLRNPLYYIGFLLIAVNIGICCKPYLMIHYYEMDYTPVELEERVELDVYKGYIPPNDENEQLEIGLQEYKKMMLRDNVMSLEEVNLIIDEILSRNMNLEEAIKYLNRSGSVHISADLFDMKNCLKAGDSEEINNYISGKLSEETYTSFFSKKYVDYLGIHVMILCSILLIFLTLYDFSKNTYELLHTKSISPFHYVLSKLISGVLSIMIYVIIITLFFDCVAVVQGIRQGFPVNFFDIWQYVLLCTVPSVIFAVCLYIFITCLFKKTIVAIPIILLFLFYANQGVMLSGRYVYKHRLFQITPRFPDLFFETSIDGMLIANQILLVAMSVILLLLACKIWERRRII